MTLKTAAPGSIWTVPDAGDKALCLVLSPARGVSRGRPEHQIVPLYVPDPLFRLHTSADFLVRPDDTTLGVGLHAALWNLRPLLLQDLGEQVGEVSSQDVLADLRDAFLRLADPAIEVRRGRLGTVLLTKAAEQWRAQEIGAWQPLSGRVFEPFFAASAFAKLGVFGPWVLTVADIDELRESIERTDELVGGVTLEAVGSTRVFLSTNVVLGVPQIATLQESSLFSTVVLAQPRHGRFVSTSMELDLGPTSSVTISEADSELAKVA